MDADKDPAAQEEQNLCFGQHYTAKLKHRKQKQPLVKAE